MKSSMAGGAAKASASRVRHTEATSLVAKLNLEWNETNTLEKTLRSIRIRSINKFGIDSKIHHSLPK